MTEPHSEQRSSGDLDDPRYYLNRELAELAYQRRVLYQAADERNALLQRVRFMSFFTRNTDEFVMKRIGGLKQEIEAGDTKPSVDGRSPREQWNEAFDVLRRDSAEQDRCWLEDLAPALADAGIRFTGFDELREGERERLREHCRINLLPRLSPLAFNPAHPFPFISNLSLSLGVLTRTDDARDPVFTRIKIPTNHPRLLAVECEDAQDAFLPVEQLMLAHLEPLLPECEILATSVFRLTRSAEVELDQEVAEDLLERVEQVIDKRRFAGPVRLEIAAGMPDEIRELLVRQHGLAPQEVIERRSFLGEGVYSELAGLDRPALKARDWTPQPHPEMPVRVEGKPDRSIFARLREGDLFVHLPYHDFDQTILRFFQEAARDPQVTALKTTIYRTAEDSPVVDALLEAVDSGKEVAVMVELKARFDEAKNIDWVERLQPRGVHVAYGTPGLKAHTKTTLVVREEGDGVRLYSHLGTGNYNSETAKSLLIGLVFLETRPSKLVPVLNKQRSCKSSHTGACERCSRPPFLPLAVAARGALPGWLHGPVGAASRRDLPLETRSLRRVVRRHRAVRLVAETRSTHLDRRRREDHAVGDVDVAQLIGAGIIRHGQAHTLALVGADGFGRQPLEGALVWLRECDAIALAARARPANRDGGSWRGGLRGREGRRDLFDV